ncbi:TPA: transporter substrate-binding domain-containing protein [Streptococcus suis]|uniref:Amino acid ABC transporter substrate-binding protein n=1 Tax=Streptococcus suis 6407 TaxID=1214179 RepID=A0A075SQY4_STRSU|nr:transporter substrate-binding domain-containing protein [Streptococcus suis]AIG43470.1 amino acid ABC transporter substrate-binding protein [Streptococcus suis 6407]MCK3920588.1 transporter substrate-binding domain-containing protein [Streptococcus suis]MCK3951686.1 transporter substrate-binding domain-containing protein [Streptococcus suis]MCK4057284.1 transporter substrate-binding domain-containing protein [Streptococcus suis]UUM56643.1 transporter substrate-binding domain-containing prot
MKKILALAATVLAGLTLAACSSTSSQSALDKIKEKGTLVVATSPDYAPFEFQALVDGKNEVVGADIMLAQKIADELGVKLEVSAMSFDNVLSSVQNGKADIAIAGLSYSEERAKVFDFSESYYQISDVLLIKKDSANSLTSIDAMSGKTLAVQKGSTQEAYAQENISQANLISLTLMGEAVNELKSGKVDAILMDSPVAAGYVSQNSDLAVASVEFPTIDENSKVIALPKGSAELKTAIDKVIAEVKASGEFDTFLEKAATYTSVE